MWERRILFLALEVVRMLKDLLMKGHHNGLIYLSMFRAANSQYLVEIVKEFNNSTPEVNNEAKFRCTARPC